MKRITIKDIARELEIHHSTVSRALRNDTRVREETRKRIIEYADTHGYQININALQLRGNVRNIIAVIIPNINHLFFSNIVSIIANLAYENGYIVSVLQSNENYEQEKALINTVIQNNVAGVIASVSMETSDSEHLNQLKNYKIPLVLFDRVCDDINVSKVVVNNAEIVSEATELLVNKGYRRIAHITGPPIVNVFKERQIGYERSIYRLGLNYKQAYFIHQKFTLEEGQKAVEKLFKTKIKPDAILCDSYILLLGVLLKLRELNLKIPDDVGVIAYSDNPSVEVLSPGITSIDQPDEEIAKEAFELLLNKLEGEETDIMKNITVKARIIERGSC